MNSVPPTVSRPLDELLADLEKLFQDREKNSPASQWEMVSLPLLGEVVQAIRHQQEVAQTAPLALPDQYLLSVVKQKRLQERQRAGEPVEEELDELLAAMDNLWYGMGAEELVVVQDHLRALRRPAPEPTADGGGKPS